MYLCINLIFILDSDNIVHETTFDCGENIIPNITGEIHKIPSILGIFDGLIEIELMFIIPEIRVFIDMEQLKSFANDSFFHRFNPEIEGMIMVVENDNFWKSYFSFFWKNPNKILKSFAGFQYIIFYFLEYYFFPNFNILNRSSDTTWNYECRIFLIFLYSFFPGEGIVSEALSEYCCR